MYSLLQHTLQEKNPSCKVQLKKNQTKPTLTIAEEEQAGKHMFTILQSGRCMVQYMNLNKNQCSFFFFFLKEKI